MANEVTVSMSFSARKNSASASTGSESYNFDMAGDDMFVTTLTVLSSGWNALSFGSITGVPSVYRIRNLDSTNYLEMATDNAGANKFCKLPAGKANIICPSSATIYVKANSADVKISLGAAEA